MDTNTNTTGSKFDSDRDVRETAKLVRKDLKAALPGFKFSVKISRYSMGQSITVTATAVPAGFEINSRARAANELAGRDAHDADGRPVVLLSDAAAAARDTVEDILAAYNRTHGRNAYFYGFFNWDTDLNEADRASVRAAVQAELLATAEAANEDDEDAQAETAAQADEDASSWTLSASDDVQVVWV
jgi:hypothetical protein